ncbi:transporter substrate-binding domain-containing protein [Vibrio sp. T187]|uniref:substrate-binding periplasmic protein n=1 Tax=Vibrio TaxID=662 RepID=UPI0010C9661A|nr:MULTISPECIES: transporter substrate-binding domain-containing protein [Vibrio]MBW3696931.1 transporter substrate-binding domain-containing protein [Vibrio sp. T187]
MISLRLRLFILSALFVLSPLVHAEKVILANGEWAPYQSQYLHHSGFVSRVITEAFAEEGYSVEFEFLPWMRGVEKAKLGEIDGTFIWAHSEVREKHFYFSDPVLTLTTSLFHRQGETLEWEKPEDLRKYTIGGVIGYVYGLEELEELGILNIDRIPNDTGNYYKLTSDRIDIVLEDTDVGLDIIDRLNLGREIEADPRKLNNRDYALMISRKSKRSRELIEAFNRGLSKLKADGRIEKYRRESVNGEYKK